MVPHEKASQCYTHTAVVCFFVIFLRSSRSSCCCVPVLLLLCCGTYYTRTSTFLDTSLVQHAVHCTLAALVSPSPVYILIIIDRVDVFFFCGRKVFPIKEHYAVAAVAAPSKTKDNITKHRQAAATSSWGTLHWEHTL